MQRQLLLKRLIQEVILQTSVLVKPRRNILEIAYNPALTHFNTNNFVKRSKKSRAAEKLSEKDKPILQYIMVGKCINFNLSGLSSTFLLRNVIDLSSYEMTFSIFSPLIKYFCIRDYKETRLKYTRGNQYYLRKHAPVESMVPFSYVITYKEDFI